MIDFESDFDKKDTFVKSAFNESEGEEHYQLSFNKSKLIFSAGGQLSQNTAVVHFKDSYSLPWETSVNKIFITLIIQNNLRLDTDVKLPAANVPEKGIIDKIKYPLTPRPKITNLLAFSEGLVLIKGTYIHVTDEVTLGGYEHPYFGIFSAKEDKALIEYNYQLLRVLLIDNRYYFVTHFQKPEACSRGLVIYRLEEDGLSEAFFYNENSEGLLAFEKRTFLERTKDWAKNHPHLILKKSPKPQKRSFLEETKNWHKKRPEQVNLPEAPKK